MTEPLSPSPAPEWSVIEKLFWRLFFPCVVILALPAFWFIHLKGIGFYVLGAVVMAAEFKLLILMVQLLVGTRKLGFLSLAGVLAGKFLVWAALASSPFWLPEGMGKAFGIGCAAFAFALVILIFRSGQFTQTEKLR